jgi:putative transposase
VLAQHVHVERGTARIRSATVSFRAGRWFVAFSVEITRADPAPPGLGPRWVSTSA